MAVAFRSISNTTYGAAAASVTCTPPTGLANGDVMLAMIFQLAGGSTAPGTPTAPPGWTQIGADQTQAFSTGTRVSVWKKIAASESGSYTWSWTFNTVSAQAVIACYSGSNGTVNVSSSNTGVPSNTTRTWSSVTTTATNCMLVGLGWDFADNTNDETPPTGMTERLDNVLSYVCDVIQSATGASGSKTNTCNSISTNPRGGFLIALEEGSPPHPSVAFRSIASSTYGAATTTITCTAPDNIVNGDVLLALVVHISADSTAPGVPTPPAGWTQVNAYQTPAFAVAPRASAWFKVASGESGSYSWTGLTNTTSGQAMIVCYSSSNGVINVSSTNSGTPANTTRTFSSVTTTAANCMLVGLGWDFADNVTNETPPTGMTERLDNTLSYCCEVIQASAGASGDKTNTCNSDTTNPRGAFLIALEETPANKPVKVWNGTSWVTKPVKVWSGSAWVVKPAKIWNGSAWV